MTVVIFALGVLCLILLFWPSRGGWREFGRWLITPDPLSPRCEPAPPEPSAVPPAPSPAVSPGRSPATAHTGRDRIPAIPAPRAHVLRSTAGPPPGDPGLLADSSDLERAEAVLVAKLLAGELTPYVYLQAMARLARIEEVARPLAPPAG
jgi:hypothetical protein